MNECSECKKWIQYECTDLPPYMICSLTKGRTKYWCQNCVDNDEISKCTKLLKEKEQHNEGEINSTVNIDVQTEITTEQKEIENLKVLLEEKEHKINILEETQSKNETTISVMGKEIENYKNEKQIQANSIKQKTEEIHAKNKTIQEYENMCGKNETTFKKQEIKSITDNRRRIQNDLNQAKNEMKSLRK